ncbi:MAG: prephenate dehydratase [Acidimicrobiia bacterium]|nr:prephenate dehydratase [Acidimicrobiia bacterium]
MTGRAASAHSDAPAPRRVAYLGPPGTFTEEALRLETTFCNDTHIPMSTIPDVLDAAANGNADFGFVAIENSLGGSVNVTLDNLALESELLIQCEIVMSVQLSLLAPPGVALTDVKRVVSFPMATAQCRTFLRTHLPDADVEPATSTAEAVRTTADAADPHTAAIGAGRAAEIYRLISLAADIGDDHEQHTRFVAVAASGIPAATGHDKTSIVIFQREDVPGSLAGILHEFAARSINLTKLESRPTKEALGDYCFVIDLEGHIADDLLADSLLNIQAKKADVKFLGSYPAASWREGDATRRQADSDWQRANDWLANVRAHLTG